MESDDLRLLAPGELNRYDTREGFAAGADVVLIAASRSLEALGQLPEAVEQTAIIDQHADGTWRLWNVRPKRSRSWHRLR